MKETKLKKWTFQWGEPSNFPMMRPETEEVLVPHDFVIGTDVTPDAPGGADNGFYQGKKGSYTIHKFYTSEDLGNVTRILYFDGVAGAMKLVVNGHVVGRHHYAYTPFYFDISKYLEEGDNRITVTANTTNDPNSRWYLGGGLYREVTLFEAGKVFVKPDGIFVRSEEIENNIAEQIVTVDIENKWEEMDADIVVSYRLRNSEDWIKAIEKKSIILMDGENHVDLEFDMANPSLWDIDTPNLYELKVQITDETGTVLDEAVTTFGIRTIEMNAKDGLLLNGKTVLLKGGCIHHDNGILGARALKESEYRKVRLHKENGFNALRFAHNPMSKHLLNACDEMGILVIDEAFDVWNMEKSDFDFSQYFEKEADDVLTDMVRRDRNHPCVFMWSVGNEIPEQGGLGKGYETSKHLVSLVRRLDNTRAVGGALCSFFRGLSDSDNQKYWASIFQDAEKLKKDGMVNLDCEFGRSVWDEYTAPFVEDWDAVGYNYLQYQYEPSHEKHPNRVMIATESKPREFISYWEDVKRLPYLIGDFEWTSMDYLGEAGIGDSYYVDEDQVEATRNLMHISRFPSRTAGSGDFDILGFKKPQLAFKRIVWGSDETLLLTHNPKNFGKVELLGRYSWGGDVRHSYTWNSTAGGRMTADVYSKADTVELFVNGRSLGKEKAGVENEYKASFEFTYEPGELLAVSYNKDGEKVSEDKLISAKKKEQIVAKVFAIDAEGRQKRVDRKECIGHPVYLDIQITDALGTRVTYAEDEIKVDVLSGGKLLALGTGRSATEENYTAGAITAFEGRAMAVVLLEESEEAVNISISSGDMECEISL